MKYRLAKLNDANNDLQRQWFVYYYYQHPETRDMYRFRRWISKRIKTKTGRRKKAQEIISLVNTKLKMGWNPFSKEEIRLTGISEAITNIVKLKEATTGKRSAQTYRSIAKIFLKYLSEKNLDKIGIEEMNYSIAQDFMDKAILKEDISNRTYNNRITALRTIFNQLVKREYLVHNPFIKVDKLPEPETEINAYSSSDLKQIKEVLPNYNFNLYVITNLIFYCFIRPSEIVRLQFKHVLWDYGIITLPGTKTKNKKSSVVGIPDEMINNLKDWNRNYPQNHYMFSTRLEPGTKEIAPTRIAEAWKVFAEENNITNHIYDFKHTGNGMASDLGIPLRDLQLQNRHSSLDETQAYFDRFRRTPSQKLVKTFKGY